MPQCPIASDATAVYHEHLRSFTYVQIKFHAKGGKLGKDVNFTSYDVKTEDINIANGRACFKKNLSLHILAENFLNDIFRVLPEKLFILSLKNSDDFF